MWEETWKRRKWALKVLRKVCSRQSKRHICPEDHGEWDGRHWGVLSGKTTWSDLDFRGTITGEIECIWQGQEKRDQFEGLHCNTGWRGQWPAVLTGDMLFNIFFRKSLILISGFQCIPVVWSSVGKSFFMHHPNFPFVAANLCPHLSAPNKTHMY